MLSHRIRCVAITLLVCATLLAPAVAAQDEGNPLNESDNQTGSAGPGNGNWVGGGQGQAENATENATDGTGGGGLLPSMPSTPTMPSAEEWAKDIVRWIVEQLQDGVAGAVDELNFIIVGLPAPGEADDPASWITPENGWWPGVMTVYGLSTSLALLVLAAALMFAMGMNDLKRQRQFYRRIAVSTLFVVAGPLIIGLMLHLADSLAIGLAPSGEEFISDMGDFAKLGLGFLLGAILFKVKFIIILIGLLVLMVFFFMIHFLAAAWPLFWALRALPIPTLRSYGDLGITAFGLIILLRITQAFILRFLFEMPWDAAGPGSEIISLIGTAMGLLVALVALPYVVMQKVTIASAVGLGMGTLPAGASVGGMKQQVEQRVSSARSRFGGDRPSSASVPSRSRPGSSRRVSAASGSARRARTNGGTPRKSPPRQKQPDRTQGRVERATNSKPRKRLRKTDDGYEVVDK